MDEHKMRKINRCESQDHNIQFLTRESRLVWIISFTVVSLFFSRRTFGADWPAYRRDNQRSGISSESLLFPLKGKWIHQASHPPRPAWPESPAPNDYWHRLQGLRPTNTYDRVFHVVVAGDNLYYGSSADDAVYCLDVATGKTKWKYYTEAPIRTAPVAFEENIYATSDDGCLHCLSAHDGRLLWNYRPIQDDRLIGNGRMISRWPIRSGMIIQEAIVYFSCGLFPNMGTYLCAVDARTGKEIFKYKTDISAQGYMLASPSRLFLPTGRTALAGFDLTTGKINGSYGAGGCFAVLIENSLISGPSEKGQIHFSDSTSRENIVATPGTEIVATPENAFVLTTKTLYALDRQKHLKISRAIRSIEDIKPHQRSPEQNNKLGLFRQQRKQCLKWQIHRPDCYTVIKAGDTLFVGGKERVFAYAAETGQALWEHAVTGKAYGLAVSNGSLYASTDDGFIHCFSSDKNNAVIEKNRGKNISPYFKSYPQNTPTYVEGANHIVHESEIQQGYCLVLGIDTGRLAYEIAQRSDLRIVIAEPDAKKVQIAREFLAPTGLYGTRIAIHNLNLEKLPYPKYFANLIVSEKAMRTGAIETPPSEVFRLLRPDGGVVMIGIPVDSVGRIDLSQWANQSIPDWKVERTGKFVFGYAVRAKLKGQGEWTHTYADAANTACSRDTRIHGPVQIQWFGRPGPRFMIDRHHRNVPPLFKDGRMFVPGDDIVMAVDAYNGTILWEQKIPDSRRLGVFLDCGSMAVDDQYLYAVADNYCHAFDVKTGREKITFEMPRIANSQTCDWGYIAYCDDVLLGSGRVKGASYTEQSYDADKALWHRNMEVVTSKYLFALDRRTGRLRWTYQSDVILNPTITIGNQTAYFIETTLSAAQTEKPDRMPIKQLFQSGKQFLTAINLKTSDEIYRKPIETNHFEEPVFLNFSDNTLILSGSRLESNQIIYHLVAFRAETGDILWNVGFNSELAIDGGHGEYNRHPTIVGKTVYAWPYAFELATGKQIEGWKFDRRGHGCGGISASLCSLFWRGHNPWMYDLKSDAGATRLTQVTRPGCWINIIPAGGMVLIPEASSGCTCGYPLQTSLAFVPVNY
jgi:outer membrane protein assembly factor BamB